MCSYDNPTSRLGDPSPPLAPPANPYVKQMILIMHSLQSSDRWMPHRQQSRKLRRAIKVHSRNTEQQPYPPPTSSHRPSPRSACPTDGVQVSSWGGGSRFLLFEIRARNCTPSIVSPVLLPHNCRTITLRNITFVENAVRRHAWRNHVLANVPQLSA